MKTTSAFLSMLLLWLTASTAAFTIPSQFMSPKATATTVRSAVATTNNNNDSYQRILEQARQIAFSSSITSPERARVSLLKVLNVQTACSNGMNNAVCDNVQEMADLIAHLRVKANNNYSSNTDKTGVMLTSLLLLTGVAAWAMTTGHTPTTTGTVLPFSPHEWMWAARDGYLPTLLQQSWKYGGFLVADDATATVQPFLWEEWAWAVRDGYVTTIMADWFRNGGL